MTAALGGTFGDSRVVIDPAKLAAYVRDPSGPVVRHLIELGERVKQEAVRTCPVYRGDTTFRARRPGTLRDSIVKRVVEETGMPAVLVGSADPVALWVHEGTSSHEIRARRKPKLVFFWPKAGRVVAFKKVQHPGTQPNRWLVRALGVLGGGAGDGRRAA